MAYYIGINGTQQGPFALTELLAKGLREDTLVWTEGMPDWKPANAVPEIAALLTAQQVAGQGPQAEPPTLALDPAQAADAAPNTPTPQPVASPFPTPAGAQQHGMLGYQTPNTSQNNGFAVASMVLGIVSYPMCIFWYVGIVTALLAIIFGFLARSRIARGETTVGGGMALAGLILGFIYFGIILIFFGIVMIAFIAAGSAGIP